MTIWEKCKTPTFNGKIIKIIIHITSTLQHNVSRVFEYGQKDCKTSKY